jgi:ribosomal protein S18 acetylase RimI-like enzyme
MTSIRPARIEELDSLLRIVKGAIRDMESRGIMQWDDVYPDEATLRKDVEQQHMHVIEVDGQVAGMVCINDIESPEYQAVPWEYPGKVLVVHRLAIDPGHQRKKLASRLMDFAEQQALLRKYQTIRLDAFTKNPASLALYEKRGYRMAGTVVFRKGPFHCYEKAV